MIFFSDNGGLCTLRNKNGPTSNLPLRSGKGWLYEGVAREPMIIRGPGVAEPGSVCETPVISMDFFPHDVGIGGTCRQAIHHVSGMGDLRNQRTQKKFSATSKLNN